ncbi:hypothetical protein [Streptomyces sp. NPDC051211]|uniref:hypothetical protein n=1 Tax=Streptomyces sp. NPDC051211 TaxID=3154643 RepID=UPI00344C2D06
MQEKRTRENEMFAYEIAETRRAELIRQADAYRRVQQAKKAARRRSAPAQEPEGTVRAHRSRFTPAA